MYRPRAEDPEEREDLLGGLFAAEAGLREDAPVQAFRCQRAAAAAAAAASGYTCVCATGCGLVAE